MGLELALSGRDRRTLALGVVTIATLVLFARGLPALFAWQDGRTADAQRVAEQLAALRAGRNELPALRDSLRARRAQLVLLDSALLSGPSPAGVAAALTSTLEDLADDNRVRVTTLQLHADSLPAFGLARVDVRVTGIADIAGLASFMRAIESGDPPLVVRELTVSQQDPASDKAEALRVDLVVAGIGMIVGAEPRR